MPSDQAWTTSLTSSTNAFTIRPEAQAWLSSTNAFTIRPEAQAWLHHRSKLRWHAVSSAQPYSGVKLNTAHICPGTGTVRKNTVFCAGSQLSPESLAGINGPNVCPLYAVYYSGRINTEVLHQGRFWQKKEKVTYNYPCVCVRVCMRVCMHVCVCGWLVGEVLDKNCNMKKK